MIDLEELERLAKAATPGPWRGDRIDGTVKYDIVAGDYPNDYTVVCHGDNGNACDGGYGFTSAENEDYVLAANPSVVLALIAEVRRLRTLLDNRPALNAGLIEAYHTWTAGVYASDAAAITGGGKAMTALPYIAAYLLGAISFGVFVLVVLVKVHKHPAPPPTFHHRRYRDLPVPETVPSWERQDTGIDYKWINIAGESE